VEFVESVGFVGFVELIGFQWRQLEIHGDSERYVRKPNNKAQMPNQAQNPNDQSFITPLTSLALRGGHGNDKCQRPNDKGNPKSE
jgi:hypothetical protein